VKHPETAAREAKEKEERLARTSEEEVFGFESSAP